MIALLSLLLLTSSIPAPLLAEPSPPSATAAARVPPAAPLSGLLDQARELIKDGDYDNAIGTLKPVIELQRAHPDSLREAYLLLIKTYVFVGNDLRFKPQGREASNLNYQEAKKLIGECLKIRELRHTYAQPDSEYPPEMIAFFSEVRSQMFGSFRVAKLDPPGARVTLDSELLRPLPGESLLGDVDLLARPYLVVVRAKGFKDVTETIVISPGATLERPYRLSRKRGAAWYATASTAAVALVVGVLSAGKGNSSQPPTLQPLPPAPLPPSQ